MTHAYALRPACLLGAAVLLAALALLAAGPAHAQTTTATIPVGSTPSGVGVNAATNTAYVANALSGTVSVIDGATNAVTATVAVGSFPLGVGVNAATNTAYVANALSGTVSVIEGPAEPVPCSQAAPLSFDADGSSGDGTAVGVEDFASVSGSFMGASGEFAGVRHEGGGAAVDLSACSFVTFDPFEETVIHAQAATGTVAPDGVYTFATAGGDQATPPDVFFDDPGAFALVVTGATPP